MSFYPAKGGGKKKYKRITVKTSSTGSDDATIDVTVDGKTTTYHHRALQDHTVQIADGFTMVYTGGTWNVMPTDGLKFAYKIGSSVYVNTGITWGYQTYMDAIICINSGESIQLMFE